MVGERVREYVGVLGSVCHEARDTGAGPVFSIVGGNIDGCGIVRSSGVRCCRDSCPSLKAELH